MNTIRQQRSEKFDLGDSLPLPRQLELFLKVTYLPVALHNPVIVYSSRPFAFCQTKPPCSTMAPPTPHTRLCHCEFICSSPICMPFWRARIFCCCCSSREVRAFTCLSVSSKTTAFSRWPRVCRKHTQSAHPLLLYNTQRISFSTSHHHNRTAGTMRATIIHEGYNILSGILIISHFFIQVIFF